MSSNAGTPPGDVFDVRKGPQVHRIDERARFVGDRFAAGRSADSFAPRAGSVTVGDAAPAPTVTTGGGGPRRRAERLAPNPLLPTKARLLLISSPMVGTFYAAASPDSPPFVKVGDHVGPETTVCIIEAMKVFNEIPAECSGQIVAVLVENGEPVEFGQPLFKVEPNA